MDGREIVRVGTNHLLEGFQLLFFDDDEDGGVLPRFVGILGDLGKAQDGLETVVVEDVLQRLGLDERAVVAAVDDVALELVGGVSAFEDRKENLLHV